jgi:hypothetical protein
MRWDTESFRKKVEENEGYKLLSEYTGTHNKVTILHEDCGLKYEVSPTNFLAGKRCPKCARAIANRENAKKPKNRNRTTESFKKEIFDLVGDEYTLLSDFVNTTTKVKMKHNTCGLEYDVRPDCFLNNRRCPKCSKKQGAEKHKIGIKTLKARVEEVLGEEYEVLLKQPYTDNNTKIKVYHTKCGKLFEATPSNLLLGKGCSNCYKSEKYTNETFQEALGDNYTLLSNYSSNKEKVKIRHNKCGHEWSVRPVDILHPYTRDNKTIERCPKCNTNMGKSKYEDDICDYLKSIGVENISRNDRTILGNKQEIDIYLPDYKIGIEFDGLYWHSEDFVPKDYHIKKTELAVKNGIRLIHLFEDEWVNKQDIVKRKLKYMTQHVGRKVFARKCYIEEITAPAKKIFLEDNHIQGTDSASIKLGLWYPEDNGEDTLVAVMTFCKPRLSLGQKSDKTAFDYELSRYATEGDICVIGGFSKLFKYFERNFEWNRIITYADRRWSDGNLYLKNNFRLDHTSSPSYFYIDKNNIKKYNRFGFRKQELKKKFPDIYSDDKTEFQIMREAGYLKIYDCGNFVFYYER